MFSSPTGHASRTVASRPVSSCSTDASSRYRLASRDRTRSSLSASLSSITAASMSLVNRGSARLRLRSRPRAPTGGDTGSGRLRCAAARPLGHSPEPVRWTARGVASRCSRPRLAPVAEHQVDLLVWRVGMASAQCRARHPLAELIHVQCQPQPPRNLSISHTTSMPLCRLAASMTLSRRSAVRLPSVSGTDLL
jgi:hypothetical protein